MIIIGILTLLLWAGVGGYFASWDTPRGKVFAIIWFFVGAPISMWLVISLFHFMGIRSSNESNNCEIDYSRAGVSSVICSPN